jgi:phospholipid/cholesterol/gamma-HCH transport system permease protein
MGLVVAFLGAVVLQRFGANYYISHLVGYGILRELGALMTGIILAGRTGAAFAAEIGSMKVSEEIDAFKTLGISPIDFLVLPRLLALFFMTPLLVIYANVVGLASGMLVSNLMLDVPVMIFLTGMLEAVSMSDFYIGLIKAVVFGKLVAVSGCLRGMQSGNSADAVGSATTSAVVTGLTLIIFFNAVIDWVAALYEI